MRLAIIIPTTNGPVRIERITRLSRAPLSQVITADDFVPNAEMAGRYHALIDQSGPLRGLIALGDVRFELCLDRLPEMGRSWELAVAIAHWAIDHGHELVTSDADLVVWATGVVRPGREIAEEDYHLDRKRASSGNLPKALGNRLLMLLPPNATEMDVAAFRADFAAAEIERVADVDAGVAALEKLVHAARHTPVLPVAPVKAAQDPGGRNWGLIAAGALTGLVLAAGAGFYFLTAAPERAAPVTEDVAVTDEVPAVATPETGAETDTSDKPVSDDTVVPDTVPPEALAAEAGDPPVIPDADVEEPSATTNEAVSAETEDAPPATDVAMEQETVGTDEGVSPNVEDSMPAAPDPVPAETETVQDDVEDKPANARQTPAETETPVDEAESSPLVLVEHRAPPGSSCMAILFGSASAVRVEREVEDGVFPQSDLDGLCAVSFELSGAAGPARLDLTPGFLSHVMSSDRMQSVMLNGNGSDSFFLIEGAGPVAYDVTLTGSDGAQHRFRHTLTGF